LLYSLPVIADTPTDSAMRPPAAPAAALRSGGLFDSHGRVIRDLRLSVTDRCNYRCTYCMDPDHRYMPKRELLSVDEYLAVARVCVALGIRKIRITGGEPTLYPDLDELIAGIGGLPIDDLAMTTNGSRIDDASARRWRSLGLRRLTFSLDSLRDDRVERITRAKTTATTVIDAIDIARRTGFSPIKLNVVMQRDVNDDEAADFADFAREHGIDVRLIEFMPLDSGRTWNRRNVVSADEMLERIRARHELIPLDRADRHETSLSFGFADGAPGRIGIIASVTRPFCGACSRLRITADGKVRPCLFSHDEWDLRPILRNGAHESDIARFIGDAIWTKQAGHGIDGKAFRPPERGMSAIGG
jgi:cyclic pyranopterin phosphate synthase